MRHTPEDVPQKEILYAAPDLIKPAVPGGQGSQILLLHGGNIVGADIGKFAVLQFRRQ